MMTVVSVFGGVDKFQPFFDSYSDDEGCDTVLEPTENGTLPSRFDSSPFLLFIPPDLIPMELHVLEKYSKRSVIVVTLAKGLSVPFWQELLELESIQEHFRLCRFSSLGPSLHRDHPFRARLINGWKRVKIQWENGESNGRITRFNGASIQWKIYIRQSSTAGRIASSFQNYS